MACIRQCRLCHQGQGSVYIRQNRSGGLVLQRISPALFIHFDGPFGAVIRRCSDRQSCSVGLQQFSGIYLGLEPIVSILQSDGNPGCVVAFRGAGQPYGNRLLLILSHCQVSVRKKVYKGKVAHIQRNLFHYYPCMLVNARTAA